MLENGFDPRISGGHEFRKIPLTTGFTRVGKDGGQCIPLREGLPVALQIAQLTHKETPTNSRICLVAGARVRRTDMTGDNSGPQHLNLSPARRTSPHPADRTAIG